MAESDQRALRNDTIRTFLTPLAIFVSALTVFLGFQHDDATQRRAARETFQLEAAKLVMAQQTCTLARQKALTLVRLFPERLPEDFVDRSTPRLITRTSKHKGTTVTEKFKKGPCKRKRISATALDEPVVQPAPTAGRKKR